MTLDQRLSQAAHHVAETVGVPQVNLADIRRAARTSQRRRMAFALATAATVAAVGIGAAGGVLSPGTGPGDNEPAQPISQPRGWTPERIRAEGVAGDVIGAGESGLTARLYIVCDGPSCNPDGGGPQEYKHRALEVTRDQQTALFEVTGIGGQGPWIQPLDEDSVFVEDTDPDSVGSDEVARFRVLRADGAEVPLRIVDQAVAAGPGALTVIVDDFLKHSVGMGGGEKLYVVDEEAQTLRPAME